MKRRFTRPSPKHRSATHAAGLTLIECMFATAVLATAVLGLCHVVVAAHAHLQQGEHASRAVRLAEHLLEEIASRPYDTPGASRASWSVADYDGLSEQPGELRDFTGALHDAKNQMFSRQVTVSPCNTLVPELDNLTLAGMQVEVTVSHEGGMSWRMTRFIPQPVSP